MNCSYSRPISGLSGGVPPDPPRRPPVRPPGRPAGKFPEIRGAEISAPRGAPPGGPPGPPWDPLWDPPPGTPFWDPPGALPGDPRGTPGGWSPPSNPPELGRLSCGPAWVPAGVQSARGALSGGPAAHLRRKCGIFAGPPHPACHCTAEAARREERPTKAKRRCEDHPQWGPEWPQIWDGTGPPGGYHPPRTPLS